MRRGYHLRSPRERGLVCTTRLIGEGGTANLAETREGAPRKYRNPHPNRPGRVRGAPPQEVVGASISP